MRGRIQSRQEKEAVNGRGLNIDVLNFQNLGLSLVYSWKLNMHCKIRQTADGIINPSRGVTLHCRIETKK